MRIHTIVSILVVGAIFGAFAVPQKTQAQTTHNLLHSYLIARQESVKTAAAKKAANKKVPRHLDGQMVSPAEANRWPVAVMIDNHTSARPQSGLQAASVVYESLAEGGIPRFMAVYADISKVPLIGPVRSARPYFVRYAAEYPAAIAHAGGSPDAQTLIRQLKLVNLEGIKGPFAKYFFRKFGSGVHNLYATGPGFAKALQSIKYDKIHPTFTVWSFVGDTGLAKRPQGVHGANVDLGYGASYKIRYVYDRATNSYLRFTGGRKHIDRATGKQVAVKNVILLSVPKEKVLDKKGRLDIQNVGTGQAVLLQNGVPTTIRWIKPSQKVRTKFVDAKGHEVPMLTGNTWITIVPKGHPYTIF